MQFARDLSLIKGAVQRDTAMAEVDSDLKTRHLARLQSISDKEAFLLEAMALFARAGNGHTRVIPNAAIQTIPLRLLWASDALWSIDGHAKKLCQINGTAVDRIFEDSRIYLAGTLPRQKVIGGLIMAWPQALRAIGVVAEGDAVTYGLDDGCTLSFRADDCKPAQPLYPMYETGALIPNHDPFAPPRDPNVLRLASFSTDDNRSVEDRLECALTQIAKATQSLIVDLRGNPGGDFIRHLPILDALQARTPERTAVLVDRFTFSAAIVFAALCQNRLNARLIGEDMGDGAIFHAEGGTLVLPDTGAHLRWSDGFHDWSTGQPAPSTPPEITELMTDCGSLIPDIHAVTTPADLANGRDPALEAAQSYLEASISCAP